MGTITQEPFSYLASPVTGGVPVNRFQQLFLLAMGQGKKQVPVLRVLQIG